MFKINTLSKFGALFIMLIILPSCKNNHVASIGKYHITSDEANLATKMSGLGDFNQLQTQSKKVIATKLLNNKILEDMARDEKIDQDNDAAIAIRTILVSKYIEKHSGDFELLAKKRYDTMVEALSGKKIYTVSHILVKNESDINRIYKKLTSSQNWQDDFNKLAKESSIDKVTAKNGGFIGNVPETQFPEGFFKYIKNAKVNTFTKPFPTNLGYHIAKIHKIQPIQIEPYKQIRRIILSQILQEETEKFAQKYKAGKQFTFSFDNATIKPSNK